MGNVNKITVSLSLTKNNQHVKKITSGNFLLRIVDDL